MSGSCRSTPLPTRFLACEEPLVSILDDNSAEGQPQQDRRVGPCQSRIDRPEGITFHSRVTGVGYWRWPLEPLLSTISLENEKIDRAALT